MMVKHNGKETEISLKDQNLNQASVKGPLTPKFGIHQMFGDTTPSLQCNFSTDLSSPPSWSMTFKEEQYV